LKKEKKVKVVAKATMSVYELFRHRTSGETNPEQANMIRNSSPYYGGSIAEDLLKRLQKRGVKPGRKLRITIETVD
jgi:hypothetical protein